MDKNLIWKIVLIVVFVAVAVLTLYPPNKTLKPGIDLAGGTSLIYEIDTHGVPEKDKKNLAVNMITVLRRRIDPANIQNLMWRPLGNSRFEIQVPLASAEARVKRQDYEASLDAVLSKNVSPSKIMRSLKLDKAERDAKFAAFSQGSQDRLTVLEDLGKAYDERKELRDRSNTLNKTLGMAEKSIELAGLNLNGAKQSRADWSKLDDEKLAEALNEFLGSETNLDLMTKYVKTYGEWVGVVEQLTDTETGKNIAYKQAQRKLGEFSLTEEQLNSVLDMDAESSERGEKIEALKRDFPDRAEAIGQVVSAFDEYRPFKGRLDDPKDIQRMLKGAGILEFRILPTFGHADTDQDEMADYVDSLKTKGPKFASSSKYVWCEIETEEEAAKLAGQGTRAVVGQFGEKFYVLASHKPNEIMLHGTDKKDWKLKEAKAQPDEMMRRAIGFTLDDRGGMIFSKLTGTNMGRPLCILLDGVALSAPTIQARISTRGIITGDFTVDEQTDMVNNLNAGSLPARLIEQPISVKTIGPSIGADNRDQGIKAGIIGLIVVVACMAVYYTLAGMVADVALVMNLLFVLGIMALVRATFTLPGIAGMILTIGMSVDANVLIFERIREEQEKGSSLRIAVRNGYQRAFRTIFDANLTTFITAAILFWVASEEIKGFAIVLMLGIASSMFTALFATRVIFDLLLGLRIIKDHLVMLRLIRRPNVNWMKLRPVFLTISALLIAGGLVVFFTRDQVVNNKYDIEFTGGTSVQVNLKNALSRQEVEDRIRAVGTNPDNPNPALAAANVYSIGKTGKQYEIATTATNKATATVTAPASAGHSIESAIAAIEAAQAKFDRTLNNLQVTGPDAAGKFTVATSQMNTSLVTSVLEAAFPDSELSDVETERTVDKAIVTALGDELEILQNLEPEITSQERITEAVIDSYPELGEFVGGVKIACKIQRAVTGAELDQRLMDLRFKPDTQQLRWYEYRLLGSDLNELEPNRAVDSFVYLSVEPEAGFRQLEEDEWNQFADNEKAKVLAAGVLETSLPRVTQIDPSVGAEAKTRALIAIVLSLLAIVGYIWIRFGTARYGFAAIVALVHDVCIALGAVTACTYFASTGIGEKLLIGDFKIDLAMIAAFLTLIGYSLNDTIVVFDRIRENRHKAQLVPQTITDSINQTISRTVLTSFTTFIVVLIMYVFGGPGLRGFTFAIGLGVIVGTYSSIAIAAPILLIGMKGKAKKKQ